MKNHRTSSRSTRARGPAKIAEVEVDLSSLREPLVVSDLSEMSGRSGRVNVAISGVALGVVTLDFVADQSIREGRRVTREEAADIVAAVNRTTVLDKALDLLAVRSRSSRDLRIRLRRAGAREEPTTWAIERLLAQGYVDDAAYARQVARAKMLAGGVSRRRVVTALRQKGISAEEASAAIESTLADVEIDEYGGALAAAEKRLRALQSVEPVKRRQRLYAFLARRGYESDVIRKVLVEVVG